MANVLTQLARSIVTNRLRGSGTEPLNIGWGTGAGTAAASDTTLFSEKALDLSSTSGSRTAGTSSQQTTTTTGDTYRVTGTLTAGGSGGTVTNAGLWDNITIGSGNLFAKADFAGVVLAAGDSIALTFNCVYS
jgi:hypothetical protein